MVIFGATGDLALSKLFPALFSLYKKGLLAEKLYIVGFARRPMSDEAFRNFIKEAIFGKGPTLDEANKVGPSWEEFAKNVYYQQGMFGEGKGYQELIEKLNGFDKEVGACIMRLFYLATPPDYYPTILEYLHSTKLSEGCGQGSDKWTRLIIEKPFGKDLETARQLDIQLGHIFNENQIFRVDHYLGKETVQNMIAFRFANGIFEPTWNNKYIDHVQITMHETADLQNRGQFFDGLGNLRDVGQNHIMQLIAAVAMEQPTSFSKEGVREARANAIKALRCYDPKDVEKYVIRGQFEGYKETEGVAKDSDTETYVAMKLFVDTPRFQDVPFYVRAGKGLAENVVEIKIVFIQTCHILFKEYGCPEEGNVLTIRIQPDEGIGLRVVAKKPGSKLALETVEMAFSYHEEFGGHGDDAYEKILMDIFNDDQMLFNRSDELESSWQFINNILEGWRKENVPLLSYPKGSDGPGEAAELIARDGKKWL
jgi:glucose-6-phosphate 1-dehydrogenase